MKNTLIVVAALCGVACGGGSGEPAQATPSPQPVQSICLHGNSIMRGSYVPPGGPVVRSPWSPAFVLAWNFTTPIADYSVDGQNVMGMRKLPDWPRQNCAADTFLHHTNDNGTTDFENQLNLAITESTAPKKILVIANLPSEPVPPLWQYMAGNLPIVRKVAAERGVRLCDANLGTAYNHVDGIHPNDEGYAILSGAIVRCLRAEGVQ